MLNYTIGDRKCQENSYKPLFSCFKKCELPPTPPPPPPPPPFSTRHDLPRNNPCNHLMLYITVTKTLSNSSKTGC